MDFDDDLDEILSNFPTEDQNEKESDSADELLDLLMDTDDSPPIKKLKSEEGNKENLPDEIQSDSDNEGDEEEQAQIAALEAQLAKLKSKKKKSKSKLDDSTSKSSLKSPKSDDACKHKKPFSQCFFCSKKAPPEVSPTIKKEEKQVKKNSQQHEASNRETKSNQEVKKSNSSFNGLSEKKQRIAHEPKIDSEKGQNKIVSKKPKTVKAEEKVHIKKEKSSSGFVFQDISIRHPLISSTVLDERMKGRRLVKISRIEKTMKNNEIEGDWVTVGVLVSKMPQKTTSNGKNFSVWKLSDLGMGTENTLVGFFLFGEVNKEHWKTQTGAVIALLNPTIMKKNKDDLGVAINIDNPKKLMEIGFAKDLSSCKGVRRSDNKPCTMFINKEYGDYCEFHVQKAFKKAKAGRMELQSGGKLPRDKRKGNLMNGIRKDIQSGDYHYGGRTLTLAEPARNQVKLKKVPAVTKETGLRSVMTSDIKAMAERDLQETKNRREKEKLLLLGGTDEFKELLAVPTIGSRNLHKLLDGNRIKEEEAVEPAQKCIFARSFLKSNKGDLLQSNSTNIKKESDALSSKKECDVPKKRKLCDVNFFEENCPQEKKNHLKSGDKEQVRAKKEKINLSKLKANTNVKPMLGRGLRQSEKLEFEEDFLCYDKYTGEDANGLSALHHGDGKALEQALLRRGGEKTVKKSHTNPSKAKLKAISVMREKGGIEADDQNKVAKKKKDNGTNEKILGRVENSLREKSTVEQEDTITFDDDEEDCKKRSKKKGKGILKGLFKTEIDFDSEEYQKLLKAKSKNVGALKLAEAEREDRYFNSLEKKEAMEQKMVSTTEIKVTCYYCRECKYIAESLSQKCKDEKHTSQIFKNSVKRFFACKSCKYRCVAYNRLLPKTACSKCGQMNFEKAAMATERKGPKIGAETLQLRGKEQKFINSLA